MAFPWIFLRERNFQESTEEKTMARKGVMSLWHYPSHGNTQRQDWGSLRTGLCPLTLGFPEDRTVSLRLGLPEDRVARPFPSGPGAIASSVSC